MKCEICNKTVSGDGVTLHRVNPKGVEGIWRCPECLTPNQIAKLDPENVRLVEIINPTQRIPRRYPKAK